MAIKKGVEDRIHFLGSVSDSDLRMVLHGSDIFAMLCRDRWKGLEAEGIGDEIRKVAIPMYGRMIHTITSQMGIKGREFVEKNHSYDYLASLLVPIVQCDFSRIKTISPNR